ncbi:MAG: SURF1 family protein [Proteobacteria bacterium]|nr:SURF1 family protein [Pseudomonadota bacterium]
MSEKAKSAGLLWPTVATALAMALLISLGNWQWHRKNWKEGLIAKIDARVHAAPMELGEALRRAKAGEDLEYTRVRAVGRFLPGIERYYWAAGPDGSGWHVYAPLATPDGVVVINRGYVPDRDRDPARRPEPAGGTREIVGLLRKPEMKGMFAPDNDPVRNMWYWRDLAGMVRSMPTVDGGTVAPFFLEAEKGLEKPPLPQGGVTRLEIPNNHLQYVLTWYGFAAALAGVYAVFAWGRLKAGGKTQ